MAGDGDWEELQRAIVGHYAGTQRTAVCLLNPLLNARCDQRQLRPALPQERRLSASASGAIKFPMNDIRIPSPPTRTKRHRPTGT